MPIALAPCDERFAIGAILLCGIELPGLAASGNAIPLDVTQMGHGTLLPVAGELDAPRFDDDPTAAKSRVPISRRQKPADTRATPDLAAMKLARATAPPAACQCGRAKNPRQIGSSARSGGRSHLAEPGFKLVVFCHAVGASCGGDL